MLSHSISRARRGLTPEFFSTSARQRSPGGEEMISPIPSGVTRSGDIRPEEGGGEYGNPGAAGRAEPSSLLRKCRQS